MPPPPPRHLTQSSFVPLYVEMYAHDPDAVLAHGTAFFAGLELGGQSEPTIGLVTARHNCTGRNPVTGDWLGSVPIAPRGMRVHFNPSSWLGPRTVIDIPLLSEHETQDGFRQPLWFESPRWGPELDLAVLFPEDLPLPDVGANLLWHRLKWGAEDPFRTLSIGVTSEVSVVGYPFGVNVEGLPIWTRGTVASEPLLPYGGKPIFLVDCRTRGGQSGSPVFSHHPAQSLVATSAGLSMMGTDYSELVGLYVGRVNDQSDIGRVIKANAIVETFKAPVTPPPVEWV